MLECYDFSATSVHRTMLEGLDVYVLNNLLCSTVSVDK